MITILQPDPLCPADRLGEWLTTSAVATQTVELWREPLPQARAWGDGAIILGGRMDAVDKEQTPWLGALEEELREAISLDIPVLGICLGHQILANALGGHVSVADPLGGEDGVYAINLHEASESDPVFGALAEIASDGQIYAYESHHDAVDAIPVGAVRLASSHLYTNQAFRFGSAVGVQFHPETSPERMILWRSSEGLSTSGLLQAFQSVDARIAHAGRTLVQAFAAHAVDRALAA